MIKVKKIGSACCGCRACEEICPLRCISMKEDIDGFFYPYVNETKCIDCHLCEKACPLNFGAFSDPSEVRAYMGIHKSEQTVFCSSSGGAFTALYERLIPEGYTVYGVAFDSDFQVKHSRADTVKGCEKFRKSKYVLGDTNHSFSQIATQLKNNEKVMFTGLPCQCAALWSYVDALKISRENLLTVNILCHGAGCQKIFDEYREELDKKSQLGRLLKYQFRSKKTVKGTVYSRSADLTFEYGERYVTKDNDPFLIGYYSRLFYRKSCGQCRFARQERASDITIGDAWKIEKLYPEIDPLKGCSLILANTSKGYGIVVQLEDVLQLQELSAKWALESQGVLNHPTVMHPNRDLFFKIWREKGVFTAVFLATWKRRLRIYLGGIKRKVLSIFK